MIDDLKKCGEWKMHLKKCILNDLKKSGKWKMYLTMKPKFMSSTNINEKRTMYSKSDSSILVIGNNRQSHSITF